MLKSFKYQDAEILIKTTMLKNGVSYFGEKDIQGEFEVAYKGVKHKIGSSTQELFILELHRSLASKGIAVQEIRMTGLTYTGVKMTDIAGNKQLE